MEERSQSGTPINLNALLIGEKTVPKGCRVMHVSSHGMLLHCEADGRPRTFRDGDSVDIHLTVQHHGEQKKLTIPSHVRHVAENSLDVEFHHPDPVLLDLIESYRISEEHTLEAIVGEAHTDKGDPDIIPMPGTSGHDHPRLRKHAEASDTKTGQRSGLLSRTFLLLFVAGLLVAAFVYSNSIDTRIDRLEQIAVNRDGELADIQNRLFSASLLEGKYATLDNRITALDDSVASMEQQMQSLAVGKISRSKTTKPTPTARRDATGTPKQQAADQTASTAVLKRPVPPTKKPADMAKQSAPATAAQKQTVPAESADAVAAEPPAAAEPPVKQQPPAPTRTAKTAAGPWAINLMSSIDRSDIEQAARRAQVAGIDTEISSAVVKGREYWRLQVTGFRSLRAAKARASEIQESLRIKDVWFLKRKPAS